MSSDRPLDSSSIPDHVAARLLAQCRQRGEEPALVELDGGARRTISFGELGGLVHSMAGALVAGRVVPEDRVALIGPRGVAGIVTDLAVLLARGVTVPLEAHTPRSVLAEELGRLGCTAAVVFDPESLDEVVAAKMHLTELEHVLTPEGMGAGDHAPFLAAHGGSAARRLEASAQTERIVEERREAFDPLDVAWLTPTYGEGGERVTFEHGHAALTAELDGLRQVLGLSRRERYLCHRSLVHLSERLLVLAMLDAGVPVVVSRHVEKLGVLCRRGQPSITSVSPAVLEALYELFREPPSVGPYRSPPWEGVLPRLVDPVAERTKGGLLGRLCAAALERTVHAPRKRALGGMLSRLLVPGASCSAEAVMYLEGMGVRVERLLCIPEASGFLTSTASADILRASSSVTSRGHGGRVEARTKGVHRREHTVGKGIPSVAGFVFDDTGALAVEGKTAAHKAPRGADGWIPTGLRGSRTMDGWVTITGLDAGYVLSGEDVRIPARHIEARLEASPHVAEVVVVCQGGIAPVAIVHLAPGGSREAVEELLESINLALAPSERIVALVTSERPLSEDPGVLLGDGRLQRATVAWYHRHDLLVVDGRARRELIAAMDDLDYDLVPPESWQLG